MAGVVSANLIFQLWSGEGMLTVSHLVTHIIDSCIVVLMQLAMSPFYNEKTVSSCHLCECIDPAGDS